MIDAKLFRTNDDGTQDVLVYLTDLGVDGRAVRHPDTGKVVLWDELKELVEVNGLSPSKIEGMVNSIMASRLVKKRLYCSHTRHMCGSVEHVLYDNVEALMEHLVVLGEHRDGTTPDEIKNELLKSSSDTLHLHYFEGGAVSDILVKDLEL